MKTLHFPSKSALNWSGTTTKMENNNTEAVQCLLYLSNYFGFFTRFSFSSYKKVTFIRLQMQEQWIIYKCCWCVFACLLGAWVCLHPRTKQCPAPSTNNDIVLTLSFLPLFCKPTIGLFVGQCPDPLPSIRPPADCREFWSTQWASADDKVLMYPEHLQILLFKITLDEQHSVQLLNPTSQ